MKFIQINHKSGKPIYKQIIRDIYNAIDKNLLKNGSLIPSVNQVSKQFSIARGSVFKAYNELKAAGIIDAIPGKGYFVVGAHIKRKKNILLVMDDFESRKRIIYNSFMEQIGSKARVDLYFHHFNMNILESVLTENIRNYNCFIIVPFLSDRLKNIISRLAPRNLYLLDLQDGGLEKEFPSVYQNCRKDVVQIFKNNSWIVKKYKKISLIMEPSHIVRGVKSGFQTITKSNGLTFELIPKITSSFSITKKTLYVLVDDEDLVRIIQLIRNKNFTPGKEIGILSYNETPLKGIIGNGLTTISTDFALMGKTLAEIVLNNQKLHIENPCKLTLRNSL